MVLVRAHSHALDLADEHAVRRDVPAHRLRVAAQPHLPAAGRDPGGRRLVRLTLLRHADGRPRVRSPKHHEMCPPPRDAPHGHLLQEGWCLGVAERVCRTSDDRLRWVAAARFQ